MSAIPLGFVKPKKQHYLDALSWLAYTCLGGLLPLWGSWLLLKVCNQPTPLKDFVGNGEFALYAAAFLSPAMYQLFRTNKGGFPAGKWFGLLVFFLLAFSAILFAGVLVTQKITNAAKLPSVINETFLLTWSTAAFIVSVGLSFVITVIEAARDSYDPIAEDSQQQKSLANQLRKMRRSENER